MTRKYPPLSLEVLKNCLNGVPVAPETMETIDSTNAECVRRAAENAGEGAVIVAASQSAGRGTRGRQFRSPCGTGVYFSMLLRPAVLEPEFIASITPALAVAAARAVDAVFGVRTGIKWVNDVYLGGKKAAGILAEAHGGAVIAGVGINISPPEDGFDGLPQAGYITESPPEFARETVAAGTVRCLWEFYKNLDKREFLNEYRERSVLIGREITVMCGDTAKKARALAVTDDFGLVTRDSDGVTQVLRFGEVSIQL